MHHIRDFTIMHCINYMCTLTLTLSYRVTYTLSCTPDCVVTNVNKFHLSLFYIHTFKLYMLHSEFELLNSSYSKLVVVSQVMLALQNIIYDML